MGKICLPAVSLRSAHRLIACLVLLVCLTGVSTQAASNQASAVLRIQVTVVPIVRTTTAQPNTTSTTGSVTYNLQPSTAPKMTSQVTIQQISTTATGGSVKVGSGSEKAAVLETTTIVAE